MNTCEFFLGNFLWKFFLYWILCFSFFENLLRIEKIYLIYLLSRNDLRYRNSLLV